MQEQIMNPSIHGVSVPDGKIAREITELVRDTASPLLFHHSSRVYYFGALAGKHRGLSFDPERTARASAPLLPAAADRASCIYGIFRR
jgi:hypothetical protein